MTETAQGRAISWALQLLGATAGLGAIATATGGALLWLRFDALALPSDEAVAVLPTAVLLTVGLHALAVPVCLAILATLLVILCQPLKTRSRPSMTLDGRPNWRFWAFVAAPVALAGVLAIAQTWEFRFPEWLIVPVAVVCAWAAIWIVASNKQWRVTSLAWVVGAAYLVCGIALAVAKTMHDPVMEPVAVVTDSDYTVSGFFVGQTSERYYVAPLPGGGRRDYAFADARVDRILEIPRDTIRRTALRAPVGIEPDEAGREQAAALLAELQAEGVEPPRPEPIQTKQPVTTFAPLVHLHAREELWPMSAERFLDHAWLLWAHEKCLHWDPVSRRAVDKPPADSKGRFVRGRLSGGDAYRHAPASTCDPGHPAAPAFSAGDHTRPYDLKDRDPALPAKEGWYLDLDDPERFGEQRLDQEGAQTVLAGVPVYYEMHDEKIKAREGIRITYWLFYGLSRPPGPESVLNHFRHEGDWERISVLLQTDPKDPNRYLPVSARYHSHDEQRDIPWTALNLVATPEETVQSHPVVFSARGSHASFARAGKYATPFRTGDRELLIVEDDAIACPRCPQWRTWEDLKDASAQPWYGFGGSWGDFGSMTGTTGPLGPSRYKTRGLSLSPNSTVAPGPDAEASVATALPEGEEE